MSSAVSEISKKEAYLEKKALRAAKTIFESDFGREASSRVEELNRRFNPEFSTLQIRKFGVRTKEEHRRVLAWLVGQRVRMERERQGLRQEDLAEKAGIKRPNIARLEKGKHLTSVSTLQKIAHALSIDMSRLMAIPTFSEEDILEFKEMAEEGIEEWGKTLEEEDSKK